MDILIASNNKHKVQEITSILQSKFDNIYTLKQLNIDCDPEENGKTFFDNALIKATEISKHTDMAVLADDTGLCVHSLNNEPGVLSARYASAHNDKANRDKLLANLLNYTDRTAHFETVVVLMYPNGEYVTAQGRVDGYITTEEQGNDGFGYDCIFHCGDLGQSFGTCTEEEKNSVSHRARAIHHLLEKLD